MSLWTTRINEATWPATSFMSALLRQYTKGVLQMFWRVLVVMLLVAAAVGIVVQRTVTDSEIVTAAQVMARGIRPGAITLKGTITYANNNNSFIMSDGTGKVHLLTCPVWWKRIDLHLGDKVMVVGEAMRNQSLTVKSDFTLSVYKIFVHSDEIVVRGRPGKPPWSSLPLPKDQSGY